MYENKCAICGQPILGYWYEVGKKNVCQSCAASTTVYDLFQRDIVDIKPDIVDSEATLVTKDNVNLAEIGRKAAAEVVAKIESGEMDGDPDLNDQMTDKSQLNAEYGMVANGNVSGDIGNNTLDAMYYNCE